MDGFEYKWSDLVVKCLNFVVGNFYIGIFFSINKGEGRKGESLEWGGGWF